MRYTTTERSKKIAEISKWVLSYRPNTQIEVLADFSRKLIAKSTTHHRLCECACNGCTRDKSSLESWKAYDQARREQIKWIDKRLQAIEKQLTALAASLHFQVEFEGDPRGATVRLYTDAVSRNEWGDIIDYHNTLAA